jgi:hypothetical protein
MSTTELPVAEVSPPELRTFVTEKKLGLGEDGPPISVSIKGLGDVVAVFDGMGGAGAIQVPAVEPAIEDLNKLRTMAYVASNAVSSLVGGKLRQWGKGSIQDLQMQLNVDIPKRLSELAERPNGRGMKPGLKGTLLQEYPTTIAIGFVQNSEDNLSRTVSALWAGDSRICVLDPDSKYPLQIVTRDHTSEGGGGDAALGRFASASGLDLEFHSVLTGPHSAVIAMTDGCYGYMSDFDLMYLLVNTLQLSRDLDEWVQMLEQQISARAGDDAALSISLGIGGYKRLRELTASRLNDFHDIRNVPQYSPYVSAFHIESFRSLMSKENDGSIAPPLEVPVVEVPVVEVPVVEVPVVEVPVVEVPVVEFDLKTSENEDDSKLDKVKKYFEEKLGNKNG